MKKSLKAALAFALALVIIPASISAPARADDRSISCSLGGSFPIVGTTSKYTVTAADQGKYIAVLVKAVNSAGTTSATSKSTGKVG